MKEKKWSNTYSEDKDFTSYSMLYTGCKRVRKVSLPAETVRHIWLPPRLSVISCFLPRLPSTKNGFLHEAISQAQQSRQEARDRGQSRGKPNMTDSLCRKRKLADSFIPCVAKSTEIFKHTLPLSRPPS